LASISARGVARSIALFAVVAVFYLLAAQVSFLGTVPPFDVTLLWLPAGAGALAVATFGLGALPGVLAGALLTRVWTTGDSLNVVVLSISLGSMLQAWVVALLVGRSMGVGALARLTHPSSDPPAVAPPIDPLRQALSLIGLVATGACIGPTIGALALSLSGASAWDDFASLWFGWWGGNTLGILVLMPLALHAFESWKSRRAFGHWMMPAGVAIAALGPVGYLAHTAAELGRQALERAPSSLDPLQQFISLLLAVVFGLLGLALVLLSERQRQHDTVKAATAQAGQLGEMRFRDFEQLANDWMWETDAEDRYTWMSEHMVRELERAAPAQSYLGRRRADVAASWGFDVAREPWPTHLQAIAHREAFHDVLQLHRNASGDVLWLQVGGRPRIDADGQFAGYRFVGTDVTAEKASEEHARIVDLRLRGLLEASPATVYSCVPGDDFRITFMSDNVERLVGFAAAEFGADPLLWPSRIHPDDEGVVKDALRRLFSDRRTSVEYRWQARQGDYKWLHDDVVLLVDEHDKPVELVGAWSDITERKAAEASFRAKELELAAARDATVRAEAFLATALDSLSDGFVLYDAEDRLVLCNRRYREIYLESADLLRPGALFEDVVREGMRRGQYPESVGHEEAWLATRMEAHRRADSTIEQRLPNGRWLRIDERRTSDGGTVGFRIDITSLKEAQQTAEAANRAKSQFLAVTSHEIRTPLNGVLGALSLLDDDSLEARQRELVNTARSSGEALLRIVSDVLDLSKIEAGRLEFDSVPFELDRVLSAAVDVLQPAISAKRLSVALQLADAIPPRLEGDPGRLQQVLVNLLGNAVKFTEYGELLVRVEAAPMLAVRRADEVVLRFEVHDPGIGIPQAALSTIFDDFVTADASYARRHDGAGLGLAICRRIVELAGGQIGVESEVGRGSRFWFTFPLRIARADGAKRPSSTGRPALPVTESVPRPLRILLAEDVPANRLVARTMLEQAGHRVDEVAGGTEAVEAIRRVPYDCVVMDIAMPGMDGVAAAAAIRALGGLAASVPIIAITAFATMDDREQIMAQHFSGLVTKPIDRRLLLAEVARCATGAEPTADLRDDAGPAHGYRSVDRDACAMLTNQLGPDAARAVVVAYLGTLSSAISAMSAAIVGAPDLATLRREAHKIAGSSAQVGASRVAELATAIEAACSADDDGAAAARVNDIAGEADVAARMLRHLLESSGPPDRQGS
jgi:PAS domain S-box-containing protein